MQSASTTAVAATWVCDTCSYGNGITAGPHAASTIAGKLYCYDANGSQISGDGRTITYTPFNKPSRRVKAGNIRPTFSMTLTATTT